jgi:hypothetical protein
MDKAATLDEGYASEGPCRDHPGKEHGVRVHLAVCPTCWAQFTSDLVPTCDHNEHPYFACMYDDDAERSAMSTSEILEAEPWRGDRHGPTSCCGCRTVSQDLQTVIHGQVKRIANWLGWDYTHRPPFANDPTRLTGCFCDRTLR